MVSRDRRGSTSTVLQKVRKQEIRFWHEVNTKDSGKR